MKTVNVHDKTFELFIDNSDLIQAIEQVCKKLNADYAECEEPPVLLCTLHGAVPFTGEVMRRINFETTLSAMKMSSYCGMQSGQMKITMGVTSSVKGKNVIVLEDIVDTGATIVEMRKLLKEQGASDVKICTLLYKPGSFSRQMKELGLEISENEPEYYAVSIDDDFVVGFGMDYDELGRNYSDIYRLKP